MRLYANLYEAKHSMVKKHNKKDAPGYEASSFYVLN
jgi:hypothetical protein